VDEPRTAAKPETVKPPECRECADTRKVRVQFVGNDGVFDREVACPVCGPDVTVTTPHDREQTAFAQVEKRVGLLTALAIVAAILAALAYMKAADLKSPFAQAVEEVQP
jgi:hydrogenase maturation factor HypF (carbamoyltransferase family)